MFADSHWRRRCSSKSEDRWCHVNLILVFQSNSCTIEDWQWNDVRGHSGKNVCVVCVDGPSGLFWFVLACGSAGLCVIFMLQLYTTEWKRWKMMKFSNFLSSSAFASSVATPQNHSVSATNRWSWRWSTVVVWFSFNPSHSGFYFLLLCLVPLPPPIKKPLSSHFCIYAAQIWVFS